MPDSTKKTGMCQRWMKWSISRQPPFISSPTWQKTIDVVKEFSPWEFPVLIGISLTRYITYATQLLLVLIFCGVELLPWQYLTVIPIHYLFVTVVPTVPVADAAVRGSVGILIFSAYTGNTAGVAIAAIVLWLLNTIVPVIVGTFVGRQGKQTEK